MLKMQLMGEVLKPRVHCDYVLVIVNFFKTKFLFFKYAFIVNHKLIHIKL